MIKENLYKTWSSRNPFWEKRYEESIFKKFCDYKKGETSLREDRGKIFGAGYEIFIVAFFIGLYFNQRRPLINDSTKRKSFGWEIENWGNINKSNNRVPYPKLREYILSLSLLELILISSLWKRVIFLLIRLSVCLCKLWKSTLISAYIL